MSRWQKHLETKAEPELWRFAYESFAQSGIPEAQGETIAICCQSPEQLVLMTKLLGETPGEVERPEDRIRLFLSIVDESTASLAEWIDALELFYSWLKKDGRTTTLGLALGYIHCCSDAIANGAPFSTLAQATEDMLGIYGFEGENSS